MLIDSFHRFIKNCIQFSNYVCGQFGTFVFRKKFFSSFMHSGTEIGGVFFPYIVSLSVHQIGEPKFIFKVFKGVHMGDIFAAGAHFFDDIESEFFGSDFYTAANATGITDGFVSHGDEVEMRGSGGFHESHVMNEITAGEAVY